MTRTNTLSVGLSTTKRDDASSIKKWTLLMSKLRSSHDTRRLLRRSVESRPGALSIQLYPAISSYPGLYPYGR